MPRGQGESDKWRRGGTCSRFSFFTRELSSIPQTNKSDTLIDTYMSNNDTTENTSDVDVPGNSLTSTERELIDDLILQNKTMDALIKGLEEDIQTFKNESSEANKAPDVVRFTMQLNIMKDKKARNLTEINEIIKKDKQE